MIKRIVRTVVVALAVTLGLTACSVSPDREAKDTERLEARGFTDVTLLDTSFEHTQYEVSYGSCRLVLGLLKDDSFGVELSNIDDVLNKTDSRNVSALVLDKYDYFNDCHMQTSSTPSQEPSTDGL